MQVHAFPVLGSSISMGLSFYDLQLNNSDTRLSAIVVLRFISITQTSSPFYQAMTTSQERTSYQGRSSSPAPTRMQPAKRKVKRMTTLIRE